MGVRSTTVAALLLAAALAAPAHAADLITTTAGTGSGGLFGDGGPATLAQINQPEDLARLPNGDILFADAANNRIRRIDTAGTISTFAGTTSGNSGDNGPATAAQLRVPQGVGVTPSGDVVIADTGNAAIRRVTNGVITTIGTGTFVGGGPVDIAPLSDTAFLVADKPGRRIVLFTFNGNQGSTTVAGTGNAGFSDGPALQSAAGTPESISPLDASGSTFLYADQANNRIRRVGGGVISTVAGDGTAGSGGDGGPATAAQLNAPPGGAATAHGGFLVADRGGNRVRRVDPAGTITTVAGGGAADPGDGGPPTAALMRGPSDVLTTTDGLVFAEAIGDRVRRISPAPAAPPVTQPPATVRTRAAGLPTLRQTALVEPIRGMASIRLPGTRRFVPLRRSRLTKIGSEIDATRAVVRVTVVSDNRGTLSSANARGGRFIVSQSRGALPITTFTLSAPLTGCPTQARPASLLLAPFARATRAKRGRRARRLWVETHRKRFRTRGRYATGTVRGTRWLTRDGCDSTRITVFRGVVTVRDLVRKRDRPVPRGKSYLARRR